MTKLEAIKNYKEEMANYHTIKAMSREQVAEALQLDHAAAIDEQHQLNVERIARDAELSFNELINLIRTWNGLTAAQRQQILWIEEKIADHIAQDNNWRSTAGHDLEGILTFDVELSDVTNLAFVYIEKGRINAGTMDFMFNECRHIAVGERGGMRLMNTGKRGKSGKIVPAKAAQGRRVLYALTTR